MKKYRVVITIIKEHHNYQGMVYHFRTMEAAVAEAKAIMAHYSDSVATISQVGV